MAANRLSLKNPDWVDVSEIVKAFEEMNAVVIVLFGKVELLHGNRELVFLITAEQKEDALAEPVVLASVKCHLGSGNHRTMETAIMWALYQLDWKLAEEELRKTSKTA